MTDEMKTSSQKHNPNEGEGNRSADRRYREAASRDADSERTKRAAREAKEALEGDEAEELAQAEAEGKSRARGKHDPSASSTRR